MHITIGRPCQSHEIESKEDELAVPLQKQSSKVEEPDDEFIFNGIRIHGLRLQSIESAQCQIRIPLKGGVYSFPGPFAEAETRIQDETYALATLKVGRSDDKPIVKSIEIILSEPATIENPASAFLKPKGHFWERASHAIADHFAHVEINGVRIDENGTISLDGELVKGGLISTPLSEFKEIDLPTLNLDLHHIGQNTEPSDSDLSFGRSFLKVLGKMAGESEYSLDVRVAPTKLLVASEDVELQTQRHPFEAHAQGKLRFNENLDFFVNTDQNRSFIESVLGQIFLGMSFSVEHQTPNKSHVDLHLQATLAKIAEVNFNGLSVSAQNAEIFADARGDVEHMNPKIALRRGEGSFHVNVKNPKLMLPQVSFHLDGQLGAGVEISDFEMPGPNLNPYFKANLGAYLQENREFQTRSGKRHEIEIGVQLHRSGRLSSTISRHFSSELFGLPFNKAYQHNNSIDPLSAEVVQSLSESDFDAMLESITKSKIRSCNQVELLVDGIQSYPRRLEFIQNAKKSIWLQTLIFQDDVSGIATAEALAEAAKRGVRVCVIVDGQACATDLISTLEKNRAYQIMSDAGVELRLHNDGAIEGLKDIIEVVLNNKLTSFSRNELVNGPMTRLAGVITSAALLLQQGKLVLPLSEQSKLSRGLNKGLGRPVDSPIDRDNPIFTTDSNQSIDFAHVVERFQEVMQQIYSWHEKHLIVDGEISIIGGMNVADPYMFGGHLYRNREGLISQGWRDTDLALRGPAVEDQGRAFAKNWSHLCKETLEVPTASPCEPSLDPADIADVQIIQHSPSIDGDAHITAFLIAHLNRLREGESAFFENAYFCASSDLNVLFDAMIQAARRGVRITIVTNSETSSDVPTINTAAFHIYRDLLKAGVRIFERNDGRTIHSKIAVIGDRLSVIGSANLDNRSARINSEVIAAVYSPMFANKQRAVIVADMDEGVSREVTLDHLRSIPFVKNAQFAAMSLIRDLC